MIVRKTTSCTSALPTSDFSSEQPLVPFAGPLLEAALVRREKRFLVWVRRDGEELCIHSNNTGAMFGLTEPGSPVLASHSSNPRRKLAYTQEAVFCAAAGCWVGVNTQMPNRLLAAAFACDRLPFCAGYTTLRTEVVREQSRFDALAQGDGVRNLWIECKNVTLVEDEVACFPDARSDRGRKHLLELMDVVANGERAAMFYLIQRSDGHCFGPADCIDPDYARLFWQAVDRGVEMYPYRALVTPEGVFLQEALPLACRPS